MKTYNIKILLLASTLAVSTQAGANEFTSPAYVAQIAFEKVDPSIMLGISEITAQIDKLTKALPAAPSSGSGSLSYILQDGADNVGSIDQTGPGSLGFIQQTGNNNTASLVQSGSRNVGLIYQMGAYNVATLQQSGVGHRGAIFQQGRNNVAVLRQR